jgi:hypothetical protein
MIVFYWIISLFSKLREKRKYGVEKEFSLSILASIATGLAVKIIADSFYEIINDTFPVYSNIIEVILLCILIIIVVTLFYSSKA